MTALSIPAGFEQVESGGLTFQNASNWTKAQAEGVMVQGIFEGVLEPDAYKKCNFKFTATADGVTFDKEGKERPYTKGSTVIINTNSSLESRMKSIEIGTEVMVAYQGQSVIKKGPFKGKKANNYLVLKRS